MVRSLWTAATGMNGQQSNIDAISNNLSNVNTTGYKQQRVEFEDLVYQNVKLAGTPATEDTVTPVGIQQGTGVKIGATQRILTQGSLQNTGVDTDVAVEAIKKFRPVEHRIEFVREIDGEKLYNDSASSSPTRTISGNPFLGYCFGLTAEISNLGFFTNININSFYFSNTNSKRLPTY